MLTNQPKSANILAMNADFKTPKVIGHTIAMNMRARRKSRSLSMNRLSELSGVSYGSIRRFESSGEISLTSLLKIAIILDCANEFTELFSASMPMSIQEIINGNL